MIVERDDHKYCVDIGRPTFYTDEHRDFYKKIFDVIENSPIAIVVNGMYNRVREMLYAGSGYGGGGFAFCFWFATKEDRREFARLMKGIEVSIEDWRGVTWYQPYQSKILFLKFTDKYLDHVQQFAQNNDITIQPYMSPPPGFGWELDKSQWVVIPGLHSASGDLKLLLELKHHLNDVFLDFD